MARNRRKVNLHIAVHVCVTINSLTPILMSETYGFASPLNGAAVSSSVESKFSGSVDWQCNGNRQTSHLHTTCPWSNCLATHLLSTRYTNNTKLALAYPAQAALTLHYKFTTSLCAQLPHEVRAHNKISNQLSINSLDIQLIPRRRFE